MIADLDFTRGPGRERGAGRAGEEECSDRPAQCISAMSAATRGKRYAQCPSTRACAPMFAARQRPRAGGGRWLRSLSVRCVCAPSGRSNQPHHRAVLDAVSPPRCGSGRRWSRAAVVGRTWRRAALAGRAAPASHASGTVQERLYIPTFHFAAGPPAAAVVNARPSALPVPPTPCGRRRRHDRVRLPRAARVGGRVACRRRAHRGGGSGH